MVYVQCMYTDVYNTYPCWLIYPLSWGHQVRYSNVLVIMTHDLDPDMTLTETETVQDKR